MDALLDLFRAPAPRLQTLPLRGGGTRDTNRRVKMRLGTRLEQKGNHRHGDRFAFGTPGIHLSQPERSDARMQNGFQLFAGGGIGKNAPRQFLATQPAIGRNNLLPEKIFDFCQGWLARFDNLAGEEVRVHDRNAAITEALIGGGFAHADAAG